MFKNKFLHFDKKNHSFGEKLDLQINTKFNFGVPGQNGIWVKFQQFWPKYDDEKWSKKNIFEIPPCAHHRV
jgi:hypothetical protein